jgi:phosphomannomutase
MLTISGIRGVVGDSLTPEIVSRYVASFAQLQLTKSKGRQIILGHDTRPAVGWIKHCALGALAASGIDVLDIGVVPTPTVQLLVQEREAAGGIVITASHNPQMWCGLKFIEWSGIFLDQSNCDALFAPAPPVYAAHDKLGRLLSWDGAIDLHVVKITSLPFVDVAAIRAQKFRVVVDIINGAGSVAVPRLLRAARMRRHRVEHRADGYLRPSAGAGPREPRAAAGGSEWERRRRRRRSRFGSLCPHRRKR